MAETYTYYGSAPDIGAVESGSPSGGGTTNFPTTPILTTFTGANENPLSEVGLWGPSTIESGQPNLQRFNNAASAVGPNGSAYINTVYGPDSEVYWSSIPTLGSVGGGPVVQARIQNPGDAAIAACYIFVYTVGTGFRYFKLTAGHTFTQLGSTITSHNLVAGEGIGLAVTGSSITTLQGYYNNAGSWFPLASVTDSVAPIISSGFIGGQFDDTITTGDNFGGGTYAITTSTVFKRTLLGVG